MRNAERTINGKTYILYQRSTWTDFDDESAAEAKRGAATAAETWESVKIERRARISGGDWGTINIWVFGRKE